MSFATSIAHPLTFVGHRGRADRRPRTDAPAIFPAVTPLAPIVPDPDLGPAPARRPPDMAAGVDQHRSELDQWSWTFRIAAGFNR